VYAHVVVARPPRHRALRAHRVRVPDPARYARDLVLHAERFRALAAQTVEVFPELRPWLVRRPLVALEHADEWDPALRVGGLSDLTVPVPELATLDLAATRVFVTENEVNGLAFPEVPGSVVVFGLGYGLERLAALRWLRERHVVYWGDLDTHGFAILSSLRSVCPGAASFLMDRGTLIAHRELWVREPKPHRGELPGLTEAERSLYEDLRDDRLGEGVRLEQERIGYGWLVDALRRLDAARFAEAEG
jgi:hypothetical protein